MNKQIDIYYINKIKDCLMKLYDAEDNDNPNRRIIARNENAINKYLDKAGIIDKELRGELLRNIVWCDNDCKGKLEKLGWKILTGREGAKRISKKITLTLNLEDTRIVNEDDEIDDVKDEMLADMHDYVTHMTFGAFCNECDIEIEDLENEQSNN